MYIQQYHKTVDGKRQAYWALVESVRTERGPRQRIVSWLGTLDEAVRLGVLHAAEQQQALPMSSVTQRQLPLFEYDEDLTEPRWVRVNTQGIRVENVRAYGGPWLALKLIEMLQLDQFFEQHLPIGKEQIPWSMALGSGSVFGFRFSVFVSRDVSLLYRKGVCCRISVVQRETSAKGCNTVRHVLCICFWPGLLGVAEPIADAHRILGS